MPSRPSDASHRWAEHTPPPTYIASAPSESRVVASPELGPTRALFASGRLGFGVGLGGQGIAGDYFLELDLWPVTWFGLGVEAEGAGSAGIPILGPADSDNFASLRARLSLRHRLGARAFLTGSAGVGIASLEHDHPVPLDPCAGRPDDCDAGFDLGGPYDTARQTTTTVSASFELGIHGQFGKFECSGLVRMTITGSDTLITVGPAIGFGL